MKNTIIFSGLMIIAIAINHDVVRNYDICIGMFLLSAVISDVSDIINNNK